MLKPICGHANTGGGTGCAYPYGWWDEPDTNIDGDGGTASIYPDSNG